MKGIEAFEEVPLGNKTNKSFIVKRPSQTRGPISLHDDKGKFVYFQKTESKDTKNKVSHGKYFLSLWVQHPWCFKSNQLQIKQYYSD